MTQGTQVMCVCVPRAGDRRDYGRGTNHYGTADVQWGLYQFDGWSAYEGHEGIYFYADPLLNDGRWGPRPDYSRPEVRHYIIEQIRMWREEFRINGFRWDALKYIFYADGRTENPVPDAGTLIHDVFDMLVVKLNRLLCVERRESSSGVTDTNVCLIF